jgi:hypothetical protein
MPPPELREERLGHGKAGRQLRVHRAFASRIAPHEPEAVLYPSRYRGATADRSIAVVHARLAARRYYAACWLAEDGGALDLIVLSLCPGLGACDLLYRYPANLRAAESICLAPPADGTMNLAPNVGLGSFSLRAWDWYAVFSHLLVRPLLCLHLLNMARELTVVAVSEVSVGAFMEEDVE